jgi:integrase/recombinase XerD
LKFNSDIEKFKRWLQSKRYSENTIKTYIEALKFFIDFNDAKVLNEISNDDFISFNTEYILKRKLSSSYQNQVLNAIKLFFSIIKDKKLELEKLHRPRKEHKLPNVLTKEEVKQILEVHRNSKHKVMLSLIYSCGLRRSELLNLKPLDVDSKRGVLIIRQSKGMKDRITTTFRESGSNVKAILYRV